jgi:proline iminopeptidase
MSPLPRTLALTLLPLLVAIPATAQQAPAALRTGEHQVVLNGIRVWYRVAGNARSPRPPLVFLHGGPGYNSYSFSVSEGPRLEKTERVVYYDQRGSGRSERPWTGHYQLDTLVADIEALRRALGVPKISILGHSFGGTLALEYAAKYPQHVAKMILVGAAGDIPAACAARVDYLSQHYAELLAQARADTAGGKRRNDCQLAFDILPDSIRGRVNDEVMFPNLTIGHMQDSVDKATGQRYTGDLGGALFNGGLLSYRFASPQRLTMPVLILAGREDYAIGVAQQRALAAALPHARIIEYEGAGHFLYLDQPERFTRDVVAFLRE